MERRKRSPQEQFPVRNVGVGVSWRSGVYLKFTTLLGKTGKWVIFLMPSIRLISLWNFLMFV